MSVFPRSSPARRVLPHPGGRAGRARRPAAYDELNDHLGDARVVFHRPTTTRLVRQLELNEAQDNTAFSYEDTYRTYTASAYSPTYVARLDGRAAPAPMVRSLSVAKGDTVTFSVYSLITAGFGTSSGTPSGQARQARLKTLILLGGAAAQPGPLFSEGPQSQPGNTGVSRLFSRVAAGIGYVLGSNSPSAVLQTGDPVPASGAWIRYRLTAEDGTIVDEHQEFVPLATNWRRTQVAVRAQQGGTLTLSVGTVERSGYTYFDDLTVEQTGGMIVQEQHQYAYGSPLVGLNYAVGNKRYRYGYQGQFAEKDAETGFESFELRMYNSRIGRWTSNDPEGQFHSPYVGMGNNPVSMTDPDGGLALGDPFLKVVKNGSGLIGGHASLVVNWGVAGRAIGRAATSPAAIQAGAAIMRSSLAARNDATASPYRDNRQPVPKMRQYDQIFQTPIPQPIRNDYEQGVANGYDYFNTFMGVKGLVKGSISVVKLASSAKPTLALAKAAVSALLTPLGRGSTGKLATTLQEELAIREVITNPALGSNAMPGTTMTDPRWYGWSKMQYVHRIMAWDGEKEVQIGKIVVHYVAEFRNGVMVAIDDFKIK